MKRWPLPLVASFLLFVALCISLAYWALQLFKPPLRPVTAPPVTAQVAPDLDAAASLFGGRSTMAVASNYQLQGVVMSGSAGQSVAILTAEGNPAKAVRVGGEIEPGITVKEVHRGYVLLADGGAIKRVELPTQVDAMAVQSGNASPMARDQPASPTPREPASTRASVPAPAPAASTATPSTTPVPPMRTAPASQPTVVVSPPPSQASTPAPAAATPAPASPPAAPPASTVEQPMTNVAPADRSQPAAAAIARPAATPVPATTLPAPVVQPVAPPTAAASGTPAPQYPAPVVPSSASDPSSQPLRQTRPLQRSPSEQ